MRRVKAVLVHGTFANQTDWDDPDGPFAAALKERLAADGAHLTVEEFRWSGLNAHEARRDAAVALAEKLTRDCAAGWDELFVVAHSHGGTVTRLALNLMPGEARPTGVFTLGAPFVRFKPKEVRITGGIITLLLRALAAITVLILARLFYVQPVVAAALDDPIAHGGAAVAVGLLLGWLLIWYLPSRGRDWALSRLAATQAALIRDFDPPETRETPYFCYHAIGDEAGLLLRFWSAVTWILQTGVFITAYGAILLLLIAIPMLGYQAAETYGLISGDFTAGLFEGVIDAMRRTLFQINNPEEIPAAVAARQVPSAAVFSTLAIFALLVLAALISTPVTVFAPWLLRKQWFAFGGEKLSWNLAADIQVDRRPNRISQLRYVFMPYAYFRGVMQHNYYYASDRVIRDIGDRMSRWTPPPRRASFDLERAVARGITVALLIAIVGSAAPITWMIAELTTEPPLRAAGAPSGPIAGPGDGAADGPADGPSDGADGLPPLPEPGAPD